MAPPVGPELSILVPTYNGERWIAEALEKIAPSAAGLSWEAVVVDNASSDRTSTAVDKIESARWIQNDFNRGFSQAVNRAAAASSGRILIVINQDLFLAPGALRSVHEFLAPRDAVVGGRLTSEDGRPQGSCGPFPTLAGTLARLALPKPARKYYLRPPAASAAGTIPVDWATGAFLAFPRRVFDAIGGFDESYFMYYEDVDFCLRARQAGFPTYYLPAAEAVHAAPYASRGNAPDWLKREVRRSQVRYFEKHRPRWESAVIKTLNRAYFAAHGWDWNRSADGGR